MQSIIVKSELCQHNDRPMLRRAERWAACVKPIGNDQISGKRSLGPYLQSCSMIKMPHYRMLYPQIIKRRWHIRASQGGCLPCTRKSATGAGLQLVLHRHMQVVVSCKIGYSFGAIVLQQGRGHRIQALHQTLKLPGRRLRKSQKCDFILEHVQNGSTWLVTEEERSSKY